MKTEMRGLGREAYNDLVEAFYVAMSNLSRGQGEAVALELEEFLQRCNLMGDSARAEVLLTFAHEEALRDFNERHDKEDT